MIFKVPSNPNLPMIQRSTTNPCCKGTLCHALLFHLHFKSACHYFMSSLLFVSAQPLPSPLHLPAARQYYVADVLKSCNKEQLFCERDSPRFLPWHTGRQLNAFFPQASPHKGQKRSSPSQHLPKSPAGRQVDISPGTKAGTFASATHQGSCSHHCLCLPTSAVQEENLSGLCRLGRSPPKRFFETTQKGSLKVVSSVQRENPHQ